jgi:hydroxymethylbilane synthase
MLPAVGQGALGLEVRDGNNDLMEVLAKLNHAPTAAEITAERSFLRHLGGGCLLPIAAFGKIEGEKLTLEGLVASPNGDSVIRDKVRGAIAEAEELGKMLAEIIMEKGGKKLLDLGC